MSITQTVVPECAGCYTSLTFHIPADNPVKTFRTGDLNLVPCSPLMIEPFNEKTSTLDAPPWHGTIEYSPLKNRLFSNSEGSWEFYYVPDGQSHTFWDCYIENGWNRPESTGWMDTASTWTATYHALLHYLQGRRMLVDVPDGSGNVTTYRGRCWVSSYTTDSTGQIKAVISYSLKPPENYGHE